MKKSETTNTFVGGLVMDLNPSVTPNDLLVNCLNGTLVTFQGNENVLQNDMGNGRVETAYLPEGYIPLGTTQLGGIIYIVSYNPFTNKCQIGSFPSPERNITQDEVSELGTVTLANSEFITGDNTNQIVNKIVIKKKLSDIVLHPGDKFKIAADSIDAVKECVTDLKGHVGNVKLTVATIDNNNRIVELEDLLSYTYEGREFPFQDGTISSEAGTDIDEYRKLISSDYNIYSSKVAGNLYIIAELEVINTFTVTWRVSSVTDAKDNEKTYSFSFDITTASENNQNYLEYVKVDGLDKPAVYQRIIKSTDPKVPVETDSLTISDVSVTRDQNSILTLTFTPAMSFGYLEYLATTLNIDLSLIGSNTLTSNKWRYYKESQEMVLNYSIESYLLESNTISDITLYFVPYTSLISENTENTEDPLSDLSQYHSVTIPKRKSYSGNYVTRVPFSEKFQDNSLYLVVFNITTGQGDPHRLYHCLYTNGVYNQTYVNGSSDNFDNVQLTFDYSINSNIDTSNLVFGYKTNNKSFILEEKLDLSKRCRGYTQYYIDPDDDATNSKVIITTEPTLADSFNNTFSIDTTQYKTQIDKDNTTIDISTDGSLFNSLDYNIDPDFVNLNENRNEDGTLKYDDTTPDLDTPGNVINQIKISSSKYKTEEMEETEEPTDVFELKLKGEFYNKISADYTTREFNVSTYIAPLLLNQNDLTRYGLGISDEHLVFSPPAQGYVTISALNGGGDNQGGGSGYYLWGTSRLTTSNSNNKPNITITAAQYVSGKENANYFPFEELSEFIASYMGDQYLVPVVLKRCGGSSWYIFNEDPDTGNHGVYMIPIQGYSKAKGGYNESAARFRLDDPNLRYCTIMLFCKTNKQSTAEYVPFNVFFQAERRKLGSLEPLYVRNEGYIEAVGSINSTPADLVGSLLTALYARRSESITLQRQGINNLSYYDNMNSIITISTSSNYITGLDTVEGIKFKETKMSALKERFNKYITDIASFTYNKPNSTIKYNTSTNYQLNINNLLKDTYLERQAVGIIETYIDGNTNIQLPENIYDSSLYYVNEGTLSPLTGTAFNANVIKGVSVDQNGRLQYSYSKLGTGYRTVTIPKPNILTYDYYNNQLVIDTTVYNSLPLIVYKPKAHDGEDAIFYLTDAKLFNGSGLRDLQSEELPDINNED